MTSPIASSHRHAVSRPRHPSIVVALAAAALLSLGLAPVSAAEPTAIAPAAATSASILIVSLDARGTAPTDDDVLLDGTVVTVRADDGDRAFDPSLDVAAFGPTTVAGGLLDTALLASRWYWVEAMPPAGYSGPPPILIELNTDETRTCVWEASGLSECQANDVGADGLSWTMVLLRNAPTATPTATSTAVPTPAPTEPTTAPTGEVEGTTGRPVITLPPTDIVGRGNEPASTPAAAWMVVLLLSFSAFVTWIATSARTAAARRSGARRD